MMPIRYAGMAVLSILFSVFCLLFVCWWAPLFAIRDSRPIGRRIINARHLPRWLAWVDTFDADLDAGNRELGWNQGYFGRVRWLFRNHGYGFCYWALGKPFIPSQWQVTRYQRADDGSTLWFVARGPGGLFNFHGVKWGIRFKLGWKASNYYEPVIDGWKPYPWGPEWRVPLTFSISKA